ncbi:hypothetical protein OSB04_000105 [Centaurea solstitialis]|uniref:Uncharacterized protein n=1 Tax=Centaurea solstitialis TaxID=347529 RepID=A0AA38WTN3_9ASTR|nr:hypothetical protein OSB04_000105 [Centaurea solstitialis]
MKKKDGRRMNEEERSKKNESKKLFILNFNELNFNEIRIQNQKIQIDPELCGKPVSLRQPPTEDIHERLGFSILNRCFSTLLISFMGLIVGFLYNHLILSTYNVPMGERELKVAIKFAAKKALHRLNRFLSGRQRETIQALHVVLREAASQGGEMSFSTEFGQGVLGDGICSSMKVSNDLGSIGY